MANTIKQFIYRLGFIVWFTMVFFPSLASATSVGPDSIIKLAGVENPDVFYVATNGKKYLFPDPVTFATWYHSFKMVKEIDLETFKQITDGGAAITSRPGAKLISFKGSTRVYAVSSGALARWIKKESVAKELYGKKWQDQVVQIPVTQVGHYIIGQPIENASEYNVFLEREKNLSPNAELAHRGLVGVIGGQAKQNNLSPDPIALLGDIVEESSGKLSPKFDPYHYTYTIDASESESYITLRPKAKAGTIAITVNGVPTNSEAAVRIALKNGMQQIVITASGEFGNKTDYTIMVQRGVLNGNAHLASLGENLLDNFAPAFSPSHFEYTLLARYPEEILRLVPKSASKTATIKIEGIQIGSGATREMHLDRGENIIKISVRDGDRSITYRITVQRQPHLSDDLARLKELTTDLKTIGQTFKSDIQDYYLDVDKNKTSITVIAKGVDKNARVFINDSETTKSTEKLYAGETRITVVVISTEGAKVTYRLFVNRVL